MLKSPEHPPMVFREKFLTGEIWGEGGRVYEFLLIGWW